MKKIVSLLVILLSTNSIASGIPTVDAAAIAAQQQEYIQQAARWAETLKQYEQDYKMLEQQYKAISGVRNLEGAMNYLNQYWTMDDLTKWLSQPERILNSGFDSLSPDLRKDISRLGFDKMCNYENSDKSDTYQYKLRKNCEGRVVLNILKSAKYSNLVNERADEDKELMEKMEAISQATDTKQSADYTNQLLGDLMRQQMKLQRMLEDQKAEKDSERTQDLKQEADFKAWLSQYE